MSNFVSSRLPEVDLDILDPEGLTAMDCAGESMLDWTGVSESSGFAFPPGSAIAVE